MSRFARRHLRRPPAPALLLAREGLRLVLEEAPAPVARQMHALVSAAVAFTRRARPTVQPWPSDAPPWTAPAADLTRALEAGDAAAVADAAADLSRAAEAAGARLTAAVLAEVAALLNREDADAALRVATLARDRGDHASAEFWGVRTAMLAQRAGDWTKVVRGYARVADALEDRGACVAAVRFRQQEARAAHRGAGRAIYARALHSLSTAMFNAGDVAGARKTAMAALRTYADDDSRLIALAQDLARFDILSGKNRRHIDLLIGILSVAEEDYRLEVAVTLARAGALAREREAYDQGVAEAIKEAERLCYGWRVPLALAELALAATDRGDFTSARSWASVALALGQARAERRSVEIAQHVLAIVGR